MVAEGHSAPMKATPNPAPSPTPFGRWTLRDKAAQRRLALLQGLPHIQQADF